MKTKPSSPGRILLFRLILIAALIATTLSGSASAVQWRQLARTERHDVALASDSVRLNANGRLMVWLRFIPRGERQRREAAAEYGSKEYRLHLENYEIDCGEKSAVMGMIDVLGAGGKRLSRQKGNGQPDTIVTGSVLDRAALLVCPELDEAATDTEEAPDAAVETASAAAPTPQISDEAKEQIAIARRRTESAPVDQEAWTALGNAYFDADMPRQAIEAYNRALAIKPDNSDVLNDQGAMFRQTGDFTKALANFEKALAYDPNNLESLYNIGYVYAFDLNRIDRAQDIWKRYLTLDSSSERARQVQSYIEHYGR